MISFLDLFKWDRFVATSFIELLFWLLTAVAVLLGVSGLIGGIGLVPTDPAGGLLVIAVSIVGGLAGIVAVRVACEAIIMIFRVNDSLMDIRDNLGTVERQPPARAAAAAPVVHELSFAEVLEEALAEPMTHDEKSDAAGAGRRAETRSADTGSLEARLAEIRARREGSGASARVADPAAASHSGHTGSRTHLEEPHPPASGASPSPGTAQAKPGEARAAAPEVRPASETKPVERKPVEWKPADTRKPEERKPVGTDEAAVPGGPKAADHPPVDKPAPTAGGQQAAANTAEAGKPRAKDAEKQVVDASKELAREAEGAVETTSSEKSKANDAA